MSYVTIIITPATPPEHAAREDPVDETNSDSEAASQAKSPKLKVIGRQPHYRDLNAVSFTQLIRKRSASSSN